MEPTLKKKENTNNNPSIVENIDRAELKHHKLNKLDILVLNNGWNDKNEQLIVSLGYNAGIYKRLHEKSSIRYKYYNKILTISLLVLSIFISTDSILNILQGDILNIIQKIVAFIVAFLSILNNFLKYEEKSTQHKQSAQSFNLIYGDIRNMMCIYRKDRTNAIKYIQNVIKEYDYLEMSSPDIPPDLIKQIKLEIEHDDNIKNKNIMPNNTIREIEVLVDKNENQYNNLYYTESDNSKDSQGNDDNNFNINQVNNKNLLQFNNKNFKFKINNMQNLEDIHNCFRIDGDLSEKDNLTVNDIQQYKNYGLNLQTQYEMNRFMHHHQS
jgi:hypothetical protein